ncbi:MAG: hypothetical protein GX173_09325 [Ruminococcaceae bacterium]|nr:hypothetical protein [Oscillospiraceae bacterium]
MHADQSASKLYQQLSDLLNELGITKCPARWQTLFPVVMDRFSASGCPPVAEDTLRQADQQFRLFPTRLPLILRGAALIRQNQALSCYLLLLLAALEDRTAFYAEWDELEQPQAAEGEDPLAFDLLPIYLLPPLLPAAAAVWQARQVPWNIIQRSFSFIEISLKLHERRVFKPIFDLHDLRWNLNFADNRILRIGRFNMEIKPAFPGRIQVFRHRDGRLCTLVDDLRLHRSGFALGSPGYTDEDGAYLAVVNDEGTFWQGHAVLKDGRAEEQTTALPKNDWQCVLRRDDPVISVHIPHDDPLTPDICARAYRETQALMRTCYPDFAYKAFICFSWLMDPQLRQLLRPNSNIVRFQERFHPFPSPSSGRGIFRFVFEIEYERLEDLPENTSLERALKKHYLAGRYIYEPGGFFFPDEL